MSQICMEHMRVSVLISFNNKYNKDFRSFILIKFIKEFNKGKDPDSKIQKSKKSKNYRGAPKVSDFLDLHCVFWFFFWIFEVFGFGKS